MPGVIETQIGKKGISDNFMFTLENHFKDHKTVRVSVLKSARGEGAESKKIVKKYAEELVSKLEGNYNYKIIGFTIVLKKGKNKV